MTVTSNLRTAQNHDGAAILDVERGQITTLNQTGAFVWERLQRHDTIDSIVTELAEETGEDASVVRRDVDAFVRQLRRALPVDRFS